MASFALSLSPSKQRGPSYFIALFASHRFRSECFGDLVLECAYFKYLITRLLDGGLMESNCAIVVINL
jgi:hypothetical protein